MERLIEINKRGHKNEKKIILQWLILLETGRDYTEVALSITKEENAFIVAVWQWWFKIQWETVRNESERGTSLRRHVDQRKWFPVLRLLK